MALTSLIDPPPVHAAGNDIIRLGLIGCGGRGCGAARDALEASPQARLIAIGDVFEERMRAASAWVSG